MLDARPTGAWPAPRAPRPVQATVTLPGSKSLTNRYLVLAALADGPSRIVAPLRARDTELMAAALRALGVGVADDGADWLVTPAPLWSATIDTGLAGTIMRFLPGVAALADGPVTFDGDEYARERPMATLLDGLRQAGVTVDDDGRGRMPFVVHGRGHRSDGAGTGVGTGAGLGGIVRIDAAASSQFVSGLLLSAARFEHGIEIVHTGRRAVPSQPHIDMTVDVLRAAGVNATSPAPGVWTVAPGPISGGTWAVEPDLSNAAPFLAAAMVTGGSIRIPDWPTSTTQPGDALRDVLTTMGAQLTLDAAGLVLRSAGRIAPIDADLRDVTELVTVVAALAALADGTSELRGLGHMRGHETDRLAALHTELTRVGCEVTEHADALTIRPRPLHAGAWRAYADHRMATAGAVLGLVVDGITVDDIGSTTKTLPDFPALWSAMLAG